MSEKKEDKVDDVFVTFEKLEIDQKTVIEHEVILLGLSGAGKTTLRELLVNKTVNTKEIIISSSNQTIGHNYDSLSVQDIKSQDVTHQIRIFDTEGLALSKTRKDIASFWNGFNRKTREITLIIILMNPIRLDIRNSLQLLNIINFFKKCGATDKNFALVFSHSEMKLHSEMQDYIRRLTSEDENMSKIVSYCGQKMLVGMPNLKHYQTKYHDMLKESLSDSRSNLIQLIILKRKGFDVGDYKLTESEMKMSDDEIRLQALKEEIEKFLSQQNLTWLEWSKSKLSSGFTGILSIFRKSSESDKDKLTS